MQIKSFYIHLDVLVVSMRSDWNQLAQDVETSKRRRANFKSAPLEADPNLSQSEDYFRILFSLLIRAAMRALGQRDAMLWGQSTLESVTSYLAFHVYAEAEAKAMAAVGVTEYGGAGFKEVVFQCERAAKKALENFDAEVYARKQAAGRKGGQRYCTYTFDDFLETAHMTAKDAAAHLKLPLRNVYRMREKYKNIDPNTGAIR